MDRPLVGRRAGLSRGGHRLGPPVRRPIPREPRRQRDRHPEAARRREGGRASGAWSTPHRRRLTVTPPPSKIETMARRRCHPTRCRSWPASTTAGLRRCVWYRDGVPAVLQYFRSAAGPEVRIRGGGAALRDRGAGRQGRHDLRRRHTVARLLLRRQHGRRQPDGVRRAGGRVRPDLQHRLRPPTTSTTSSSRSALCLGGTSPSPTPRGAWAT